jgi:OST-HTH/LOTUS domain
MPDMSNQATSAADARVAVLVDCDNTTPEILEHALRMVAQFGRVVLRRGYGNHTTLANKWQEALVRLAFTPCLQYQYAAGKNTADIADPAKPKPHPEPKQLVKRRPKALINAVALMAAATPDGRVGLGALGQYLKRTDPGFSPKIFGHSALSDMVRTYPDLVMAQEGGGFWVSVKPKVDVPNI